MHHNRLQQFRFSANQRAKDGARHHHIEVISHIHLPVRLSSVII